MKATYFEPWATNDERLRHKPPLVSDADWRWLVQFWSSEEAQVRFNITFFLMIIHLLLFTLHLYLCLIQVISKEIRKIELNRRLITHQGLKALHNFVMNKLVHHF